MKSLLVAIALLLVTYAVAVPTGASLDRDLDDEWDMYKTKHGRTKYGHLEEYGRRIIWEQNVKYVQEHNIRYDLGQHSYFLGINQFADLTNDEFRAQYLRAQRPVSRNDSVIFVSPLNIDHVPDTVDWVTKGYVTAVKDQGQCGSCWSFSTTGSLEGQYFRSNKKLVSFSEQQLVDCSGSYGNQGCNGGLMDQAFRYIKDQGLEKEDDYQYTAMDGHCKYMPGKIVTKISGFVDIPANDEQSLAVAVATQGPISVAIDASHRSFQFYSGGVYDEPKCDPGQLDHGVLAAGYGVENGKKYWLVKNSWADTWGLKGYIKMSKDKDNQCGIASMASYPTM